MRGRIRPPEIAQLLVDLWMIGIMWKCVRIVRPVFVPGFNFVGNDRGLFQRDAFDQRVQLCGGGRVRDQLVRNSADDFVAGRTVSPQRRNRGKDKEENRAQRLQAAENYNRCLISAMRASSFSKCEPDQ